jgi:hypothetical protein
MKTKIRHFVTPQRLLSSIVLLLLIAFSLRADIAFSQAFTQGYASDVSLQRGMIVKIVEDDTTKVEPVSQETADGAYGVVVDKNDAPATLSTEAQQVFIAATGKFDILVSNQNGSINPGDYIVMSSINGIGMKVDEVQPIVVARALDGFEGGGGDSIGSAAVGERSVEIGRIQADIGVAGNPLQKPPVQELPTLLQKAAEAIAQKPVSTPRLYLSLALLLLSAGVSGTLLYGGVRSAITSIGRNPLSKKSIVRGMIQVIIVGILIFIVGVFGVYLLLKL